jgi:ketosteroid isomerase-like protein
MNASERPAAPRTRIGLAVTLLVSGALGCRSAPVALADDASTIRRLEQELNDAAPRADTGVYERLFAEDFVGQWADGTQSGKRETIADLASGHDTYQQTTLGPLNVRVFGDTAVVDGTFTETSTLGDRSGTGRYNFIDVWVRHNGRWQLVAFKSLRLSEKLDP